MTTPAVVHQVVVTGYTANPGRDRKRVKFRCLVPGCLNGLVDGRPAADVDRLVQLAAEAHARTCS